MSTIAFADRPELASRYADESRLLLVTRLRVVNWLAIFLVPIFMALDAVLHPQLVHVFVWIRVGMVGVSVLTIAALRTAIGRRHVAGLSVVAFCVIGAGIVVMTAFNGGGSSPYYAGINLVMLAAAVLMPWEPTLSAACCLVLVGGYTVASVGWAGVPDARAFTGNLFFLASTAVITVVSHVVGSRARRRELAQLVALEESGRHREQFLANVSHELRTPLAAIFGFCEMLADYTPNATAEERGWLSRIHQNAGTLYRLIVQLLDFSNLESGTLSIAREPFHLRSVVDKVASDLRANAESEGSEIAVDIAAAAPAAIGDPERVESIVASLATNALKFAAGRPVVLRVAAATLAGDHGWDRVLPEPGPDVASRTYAEVAVIDSGEGIHRDDLRRLFVGFQQLDGSSTRRHGGTGIGLALSARLAAAMQGHIAVRSRPGVGSTFALLLPAAEATETHVPADGALDRVVAANGA